MPWWCLHVKERKEKMGDFNRSLKSVPRAHRSVGESEFEPSIIEPGESLPLKVQIDMMMEAGVRKQVHAAMLRQFHFGPDGVIPEDFLDPTQDFNFNRATLHEVKKYIEGKIRKNEEMAAEALAKAKEINAETDKPDLHTNPEPAPSEPTP